MLQDFDTAAFPDGTVITFASIRHLTRMQCDFLFEPDALLDFVGKPKVDCVDDSTDGFIKLFGLIVVIFIKTFSDGFATLHNSIGHSRVPLSQFGFVNMLPTSVLSYHILCGMAI